jgi:hypothetical protein
MDDTVKYKLQVQVKSFINTYKEKKYCAKTTILQERQFMNESYHLEILRNNFCRMF